MDSYLIVPLYTAFFTWLAFSLRSTGSAMSQFLFYAIIASILTAGFADLLENLYTSRIAAGHATESLVNQKYYACFMKWGFIAATLLFVSMVFLLRGSIWVPLVGFTTVIVFVLGFTVNRPLVQWGFSLMGATLLVIAIFR
jgi:hypothetical protein